MAALLGLALQAKPGVSLSQIWAFWGQIVICEKGTLTIEYLAISVKKWPWRMRCMGRNGGDRSNKTYFNDKSQAVDQIENRQRLLKEKPLALLERIIEVDQIENRQRLLKA